MAWEDTSSTAWVQPPSAMSRKRRCRATGSGVVLPVSSSSRSPEKAPRVPIMPVLCPAAVRMARSMWATVVLPLVPVTAMVTSAWSGRR